MQTKSYFPPLLFVCVDVCVVQTIRSAQLSHPLLENAFVTLWAGGLVRSVALLSLTLTWSPAWMCSFLGLQTIGVLCFHGPLYASVMWGLGLSSSEQLWGWHSWQRLLHGYVITAVAWLYWTRYASVCCSVCNMLLRKRSVGAPMEKTGTSLRRLLGYMLPYTWRFVFVMLLVIISSWGEMAIPECTGRMADWIMNKEEPDMFTHTITVMTVMSIGSAVLEFICDLTYNVTMSLIHTSVQGLVFKYVLKQEMAFFDATKTGDLVSRITTDTNKMSEALSDELSLVMWYTTRLGFILFFMFTLSWKISLFTCMGLPILWVIPELLGHFHQNLSKKVQKAVAQANQVATETFSNMKTVRSFANEDGESDRYRQKLDDIYALNEWESLAYAVSTWANDMTTLLLKVCILYYGGTLVTGGNVSSGGLVSFVLYELQFVSALNALMSHYPEVRRAIGASETIFKYLDRRPDIPPEGTLAPENLDGCVEFKNITFSYPGKDNPVLKDVSLQLKPGQITALVGPNGSGKSTCVRLLERFYQPQAGEILLDKRPLLSYQDQYLHDRISVVSQECVLFARSIRENIKYGFEDASDDDMCRAAALASIHDDITKFPNGYETDAGEKGDMLSGGQRQRIAIARALIRRPKVLLLDNATSDLDIKTEHQVFQALLTDASECSVLLISHNMSVVERAHHVVVLRDGEVVEQGDQEELLQRDGSYAEMVRKHNLDFQHGEGEDA